MTREELRTAVRSLVEEVLDDLLDELDMPEMPTNTDVPNLTPYERIFLWDCYRGTKFFGPWGAAHTAAMEQLQEFGLLSKGPKSYVTADGVAYCEQHPPTVKDLEQVRGVDSAKVILEKTGGRTG